MHANQMPLNSSSIQLKFIALKVSKLKTKPNGKHKLSMNVTHLELHISFSGLHSIQHIHNSTCVLETEKSNYG